MVNVLASKIAGAQAAAQAAISALRVGVCDIYEATDTETAYEDVSVWAKVQENIPCRISFESAPDTEDSDTADKMRQLIRLYVEPTVSIKPGSRIDVTQCGVTTSYRDSGKMRVYGTHNEIDLQLLEEYP